jgi:hypothetical protein
VRSGRASKRTLAVLVFAAAVVGIGVAVAAVGLGGNKAGGETATTGANAPLTVVKPPLIKDGGLILNEPDSQDQDWLTSGLSPLPGGHRYRVTVTNASNVGFINSFEWYPPTGVRILKVTGSSAGHCVLTGLSGFGGDQFKTVLLYPNIFCDSLALRPPTCTCTGDGGSMTISFVLSTDATASGAARVVSASPILKVIPSFIAS